jgi:hypothetical protein
MRKSATEILTDHARERWLRRSIRSVQLDGDRGAVRRMSEGEWVDSCALVRGVPAELLDVLGLRECEANEATWSRLGIDLPDARTLELHTEQVATPLTLAQAAARLARLTGSAVVSVGGADLRKMRMAAIATVSENMMARCEREGGRAA